MFHKTKNEGTTGLNLMIAEVGRVDPFKLDNSEVKPREPEMISRKYDKRPWFRNYNLQNTAILALPVPIMLCRVGEESRRDCSFPPSPGNRYPNF